MSHDVLVIHGAGEPRKRKGEVYWKPMLEAGLGAGYRIQAPVMPQPEEPDYERWAHRVATLLEGLEHPMLVGHSFGASVLLKYLARPDRPAFRGLFLVSTPFWKPAKFPEYALSKAELEALQDLSPVFLYQSRDDEEVGVDHVETYARAMPQATVRLLDGRGHEFDQPTFPELFDDIRGLQG